MDKICNLGFCQLNCWAYGRLLIFYPRDLRERFGEDMAEIFEDLVQEAMIRHDVAAVISLWGCALWELLSVAVPSRLQNNTVMAAALSFTFSSALFLAFFRAIS